MIELYYWPHIPGRGEFVRLVLVEAGVPWRDVAREEGAGAVVAARGGGLGGPRGFAPPILRDGALLLSQTPLICTYLGERFGLVPDDEASRLHARALQLQIADLVGEIHDLHHPLGTSLYYEEQRSAAAERARVFRDVRGPALLGWFSEVLGAREGLLGDFSYPDLALAQVIEGLSYALPRFMVRSCPPNLRALRDRVWARPRVAGWRASPACLPFSEDGLFRHYPELDSDAPSGVLAQARVETFLGTADTEACRAFYEGKLGLPACEDNGFSLVYTAGGHTVRIQKVSVVRPPEGTALGFVVRDVEAVVRTLTARGVVFERFPGMEQDSLGIWVGPARVAWLRDPDGQLISIRDGRHDPRA